MKRAHVVIPVIMFLAACEICSAQPRIVQSAVSGGAVRAGNSAHTVMGTIGQGIAARANSATQEGAFGFWTPTARVSTSAARSSPGSPATIALYQNFPNPARARTAIRFSIQTARHVHLIITDALGRTMRTLADETLERGSHVREVVLADVPAGTYFCRLYAGDELATRTLIVLR